MINDRETAEYISSMLIPYVSPAAIGPRLGGPSGIRHNGTVTFVDTGEKRLLFTCNHVWSKYEELKADDPTTVFIVGRGHGITPLDVGSIGHIIDRSSQVDLAIIELDDPDAIIGHGKNYFRAQWAPERPRRMTSVALIGFPGAYRIPEFDSLHFSSVIISVHVSGASDRHFTLADDDDPRRVVFLQEGLGEVKSLGGLSGSGVFTFDGDEPSNIVGIVYEGGELCHPNTTDVAVSNISATILITYADFVLPNGNIDHSRICW